MIFLIFYITILAFKRQYETLFKINRKIKTAVYASDFGLIRETIAVS